MRRFSSAISVGIECSLLVLGGAGEAGSGVRNHRRPTSPLKDRDEGPRRKDREDDYRNMVVAGKGDGGGIHNLQALGEHFGMGQAIVARGIWITSRVGRIDAVDLSALEQRVA